MLESASRLSLLDPLIEQLSGCFSDEGRRELIALRADESVTDRVEELAGKCDAGTLTPQERSEYEAYVEFGDLLAILQAKARRRLGAGVC